MSARTLLPFLLMGSLLGSLLPACVQDEYQIGDVGPGGGVVYYVADEPFPCGPALTAECTHLEAATESGEVRRVWSAEPDPEVATAGADRSGIGAGAANTSEVVLHGDGSVESAAAYADAYEQNGHSDWYLPSKEELFELYEYLARTGVATRGTYWSSTDYAFITAWCLDFSYGPLRRQLQDDELLVLPVRAF